MRDTVASRQHSVPLTAAAGSDIPAAADAFPPPAEVLPGTRWDRVQEAIEVMEREDRDTLYFRTKILRREEFTVEEMQEYKYLHFFYFISSFLVLVFRRDSFLVPKLLLRL